MNSKKHMVVTETDSDLLAIMLQLDPGIRVLKPADLHLADLDGYASVALLGGTSADPLLLRARDRSRIEAFLCHGGKVFAEFMQSIGHVYCPPPEITRYERLVYGPGAHAIDKLAVGQLIDNQCGMRLKPYDVSCSHRTPILQFAKIHAHSQTVCADGFEPCISDRALWFDEPENLLICSFQLCNFVRARFAPAERARHIAAFVLSWLWDRQVDLMFVQAAYTTGPEPGHEKDDLYTRIRSAAQRSLAWFDRSGMICDEGATGVLEGLRTEIDASGKQSVSSVRRADCIGETALPYYLHALLASDKRCLRVSQQLLDCVFNDFQSKERNIWYGMVRWTEEAWGVCYQDDVARAIIPQLLKCLYSRTAEHLQECEDALAFLVRTTGTDGTRVFRTDAIKLSADEVARLGAEPGNCPSAHYNAFFYAALFLAYKLTKRTDFLDLGRKGMEALMSVYPDTKREQSETQEYCRLILPLSWLYWCTGEEKHKAWLYRVTRDLQKFRHPTGGYLEWDEGYKAAMRSKMGEGESSLIARNGDPVVDLLYSNNWLPMGFIQAYFVTKDEYFKKLWENTAEFMLSAQIRSGNSMIDGAWARAFDVELLEVFGSPADAGWGPWAIESGWTVAEITSGLLMGLLEQRLLPYYNDH